MAELSGNLLYTAFFLYLIATFLFGGSIKVKTRRRGKETKQMGYIGDFRSPSLGLWRKLGILSLDGLLLDMHR